MITGPELLQDAGGKAAGKSIQLRLARSPAELEGPYRDPSIQTMPTLDPTICKWYLHCAIWIPIHPYKPLVSISCSIAFRVGVKSLYITLIYVGIPGGVIAHPKP